MNNKKLYLPGEESEIPGIYIEVDAVGNAINPKNTVTITDGDKFPPTRQPNRRWKLLIAS